MLDITARELFTYFKMVLEKRASRITVGRAGGEAACSGLETGELRPSGQHTFSRLCRAVSRLLGASSLNSSTVSLIYPAWVWSSGAGALDTGFTVNV